MKKLSLIVPTYKQEKTIKKNMELILQSIKKAGFDFEIIVVVDGLIDNSKKEAQKVRDPHIKVYQLENNHGKGYAIRYGMARSRGDLVAFIDGGLEINPDGLLTLINLLEKNKADIVIGSKRHPESKVTYPPLRRVLSFGYQMLVFILFGLNVRDTQVGLKLFKRQVLEDVLPRLLVKRYAVDIEMLAVANYLGFNKIIEAPVELKYDFTSITTAASFTTIRKMLIDTLAVFYRLRIRHYYNTGNKRKWVYDKDLDLKINVG